MRSSFTEMEGCQSSVLPALFLPVKQTAPPPHTDGCFHISLPQTLGKAIYETITLKAQKEWKSISHIQAELMSTRLLAGGGGGGVKVERACSCVYFQPYKRSCSIRGSVTYGCLGLIASEY